MEKEFLGGEQKSPLCSLYISGSWFQKASNACFSDIHYRRELSLLFAIRKQQMLFILLGEELIKKK